MHMNYKLVSNSICNLGFRLRFATLDNIQCKVLTIFMCVPVIFHKDPEFLQTVISVMTVIIIISVMII